MKVVRWPECDILESNLKVVDGLWTSTQNGPIMTAFLFPINELDKLKDLKSRIDAKKKELLDVEAEIYKVSRNFNA